MGPICLSFIFTNFLQIVDPASWQWHQATLGKLPGPGRIWWSLCLCVVKLAYSQEHSLSFPLLSRATALESTEWLEHSKFPWIFWRKKQEFSWLTYIGEIIEKISAGPLVCELHSLPLTLKHYPNAIVHGPQKQQLGFSYQELASKGAAFLFRTCLIRMNQLYVL